MGACQGGGKADGGDTSGKTSKKKGKDEGEKQKKGKRKGHKDAGAGEAKAPEPAPKPIPKLDSWAKHFGSNHADGSNIGDGTVRAEDGKAVAVDAEGNVIVVGEFRGSADFGGGPLKVAGTVDIIVAKYDKSGAHLWSKHFGGTDDDQSTGVAVDAAGNVYVTGSFSGTIDFGGGAFNDSWGGFVLALDKSGAFRWSQHLAGGTGQSIAVTADGDVMVCGIFWKKITVGGEEVKGTGQANTFVAKLDASGGKKWLKTFGSTGSAAVLGKGVATHGDGSVYVLTGLEKTVDYGGGPLTSAGGADVAVVKLDAGGGHIWSKRFGAKSTEYTYDLAVDPTGGVVFVGSFSKPVDFGGGELTSRGSGDAFVAKLDASGNHVWSKSFGGSEDDNGYDVAIDPKGNVAVTGYFQLTADFDGHPQQSAGRNDAFVMRLDASGTPVWTKRLGGSEADYGHGVTIDANGAIVATGHFVGKASYTGGELSSNGGHDIYVLTFPE